MSKSNLSRNNLLPSQETTPLAPSGAQPPQSVRTTPTEGASGVTPKYPILIDGGPEGDDTLLMGCNGCGAQWMAQDVDDSIAWIEYRRCAKCEHFDIYYVYDFGSACGGCGKLAYEWPAALNRCCSRPCMYQFAYKMARELRKRIADPEKTRQDVAHAYSYALEADEDWPEVNGLIIERWSESGLRYIKAEAWKRKLNR
jgi:hypothetical protein